MKRRTQAERNAHIAKHFDAVHYEHFDETCTEFVVRVFSALSGKARFRRFHSQAAALLWADSQLTPTRHVKVYGLCDTFKMVPKEATK